MSVRARPNADRGTPKVEIGHGGRGAPLALTSDCVWFNSNSERAHMSKVKQTDETAVIITFKTEMTDIELRPYRVPVDKFK